MSDNSYLILSALLKTDPKLAAAIDGQNSWIAAIRKRGQRVDKYRKYERGEHSHSITPQMRKMLRLPDDDPLSGFAMNYMRIIIDKMISRLHVSEITDGDEAGDNYISSLLTHNDFESLQESLYRAAVRDGDSYVMVDTQSLHWTIEPAYDGFSGVCAIFSQAGGYPLWACKLWSEADTKDIAGDEQSNAVTMRMFVYQPGKITSWKGEAGSQEVAPDLEEKAWRIGYVPVVHFVNLSDSYTAYGESELRVAIPLQDVLNRTLHSMVMASEFSAFKIAWSIGMELDKSGITPGAVLNLVLQDKNNVAITDMTAEQVAFLNACRVGEFSETDIGQYTNQIDVISKKISEVTQTPIYGVTDSGNLSGEALKQLEIGLTGKVGRFQRENTSAIRQLIELTAAIQKEFNTGFGDPPKLSGISVNWKEAAINDIFSQIASLIAMRKDAPGLFDDDFFRQRIGGSLGLSQNQIKEEGEHARLANENEKQGIGKSLLDAMRNFDHGNVNGAQDINA